MKPTTSKMRPEEVRDELCFPCGFPRNHTPCQTPAFQTDGQEIPGDWRSSMSCLTLPQAPHSPGWLVSEAMSPLGCEGRGQDSWDLALPSPCAQSWGCCWSQTRPQVLSDLYKSLLSLLVRSLLSTGRKNESPCEQQD